MNEAWISSPKLKSDAQKKAFLSDYVSKSKAIGIESTVDVMIPCLINAFNSDQAVRFDLYDNYATLLFGNMTEFIKFLGKNSQRQKKKERTRSSKKLRRRSLEDGNNLPSLIGINQLVSSVAMDKINPSNDLMEMFSHSSSETESEYDYDISEFTIS